MNPIIKTFHRSKVVLPVIHIESERQALRNAELARECGANGVWVINHGSNPVFEMATRAVLQEHADWWVGVNLLGEPLSQLFRTVRKKYEGVKGVWSDDAQISETQDKQPAALDVRISQLRRYKSALYFGGVAFKYQRPVPTEQLFSAAAKAAPLMDVVTTSGVGTGHAPDIEKLRLLRAGLRSDDALAVASGVTPNNVAAMLPYVDAFLVATGISKDFHNLDEDKTRKLVEIVTDSQ